MKRERNEDIGTAHAAYRLWLTIRNVARLAGFEIVGSVRFVDRFGDKHDSTALEKKFSRNA